MDIVYLLLSGCAEVMMVFFLKKSQGFKVKLWGILTFLMAACSLLLLSKAMLTLEAGVAYSIWVAFGSVGSLLIGSLFFKETIKWQQSLCMVVIIISVIGLKLVG